MPQHRMVAGFVAIFILVLATLMGMLREWPAEVMRQAAPRESLVIVKNPPGWWKPVDTLIVKHVPPPPANPAGIEMTGELTIFSHVPGMESAEVDSFTVELPDTDRARMTMVVGGARLPLKTERLLKIPGWVRGQPPALPGIAWRAFMYEADTLVMWGYDDPPIWVGHLELHSGPTGSEYLNGPMAAHVS